MDRMNIGKPLARMTTGEHQAPGGLLRSRQFSNKPSQTKKNGSRMMKKTLLAIFSAAFLLTGCVALQQDVMTLERRIDSLERRSQQLQKQNQDLSNQLNSGLSNLGENRANSEKNLRGQYAGLNADMDSLRQDLRLVNGRVDEIEYLTKRKVADYEAEGQKRSERLDELNIAVSKLDQRISQLEQYLNLESKGPRPATNEPAGAAGGTKRSSDQQLYSDARQAFDSGDMDKARQLFQKLIKDYPKSTNVDNAQFWIGESYYREKSYDRAILEYQTVIEKYPNGNKVPAAMLKQGMALRQIGEKASARLILQELIKKYPKTSEAATAQLKLKEL
jgi:tol-pal system protein YbgF